MADFLSMLAEASNGNLAIKLSRDLTKLLDGVLDTNRKGEMNIKIILRPAKTDDGQVQVTVLSDTKLKVPEFGVGDSIFYVDANKNLTRTDPRQVEMFAEIPDRKSAAAGDKK